MKALLHRTSWRLISLPVLIVTIASFALIACEQGGVIQPAPSLVQLTIEPPNSTLELGQTAQFRIVGRFSDNSTRDLPGTYQATAGTITATGLYSATTLGTHIITGTIQGGQTASTMVTVNPAVATLRRVLLTPDSVLMQFGQFAQFQAVGVFSDGVNRAITVSFTATGGTITQAGMYTAGSTPGTYQVIARAASGEADTSKIVIASTAPAPTVASITLAPPLVTLATGSTQQFTVTATMSDGTTSNMTAQASFNGAGGSISPTGLYTAGPIPGTYQLTATVQGRTASSTINIVPQLLSLSIRPSPASVRAGGTQQFQAIGQFTTGLADLTSQTAFSATGGTINSAGLYTAGTTGGTFEVVGIAFGVRGTAVVNVVQQTDLVITPGTATLAPGASQQFTTTASFSDGTTAPATVTYTATGGTISATGLYTAGSTVGSYTVIARETGTTFVDTAIVTVATTAPPPPPPPPPTLLSIALSPPTVNLVAGGTQQFTVLGSFSNGSTSAVPVTYSATGGTITQNGFYTAGGTAGTYSVIAVHSGGLADTSAVTITVPTVTVTSVVLTPASVSLNTGASQQFTAVANLSNGTTNNSPAVTYTATGGTITASGLYTAGGTAGSYSVIVTETSSGRADTSAVTIATPTVTSIVMTPASASLLVGGTQQFTVVANYSNGTSNPLTPTFTATGGTISAAGLYTAGATPGSYRVIAVDAGSGQADTAAITISAASVTSIVIAPAAVALNPGQTQQFSATANYSDGTSSAVSVGYIATGGTITSGGLYQAGSTGGSFSVIAVHGGSGKADTAAVTITAAPVVTSVVLTPATVSLNSGATQQFTVVANLSNGTTNNAPAVTYTATGGTISGAGLYTAGNTAGTFIVVARESTSGRADTSSVTITAVAPTVTALVLTPASASLNTGATQQFAAVANLSNGTTNNSPTVSYTATGGTITAGGLYTAGNTAGSFSVIATETASGKADTSAVTITVAAPTVTALVLTPAAVSLSTGATQQFTAVANLSNGTTNNSPAVTYSATGGTITAGGLYTAGNTAGSSFRVIATETASGKADTAAVTITAVAATLTSISLTPATVALFTGGGQQFTVTGNYSNGTTANLTSTATYSATGGTISAGGLYTAGGTAGSFRAIATSGAFADSATITLTTAPAPGTYTALVGNDWRNFQSIQELRDSSVFYWVDSGGRDVYNFVQLVPDATFGTVAKIKFPQTTGVSGSSPRIGRVFPAAIDKMWFRWRMKFDPGWTSAGPNPAGHDNSYKIAFWLWENLNGRAGVDYANTTTYLVEWGVRDLNNTQLRYNEYFLPCMTPATMTSSCATWSRAGSFGSVTTDEAKYGTNAWQDGQWYEFVVYYEKTGTHTGRQYYWRRRASANGVYNFNPAPSDWVFHGLAEDGTSQGSPTPRPNRIELGINRNKDTPVDMYFSWGPWEVVNGASYPNPWGMKFPDGTLLCHEGRTPAC